MQLIPACPSACTLAGGLHDMQSSVLAEVDTEPELLASVLPSEHDVHTTLAGQASSKVRESTRHTCRISRDTLRGRSEESTMPLANDR